MATKIANKTEEIKKQRRKKAQRKTEETIVKVVQGLGAIFSWKFTGLSWTPAHLRTIASQAGIDPKTIKDVPVSNGMNNAIATWKPEMNGHKLKAEKVCDGDSGIHHIAILKQIVDTEKKKSKWITIDRITYEIQSKSFMEKGGFYLKQNPNGDLVRSTEDIPGNPAQNLMDAIDFRVENYTGNEFRKWVIMPLIKEWGAIKVMMGSYFVAKKHMPGLGKLEAFCKLSGVQLYVFDQLDSLRTKESIALRGKETLKDRLDAAKKKLEDWKKRKRIRKDGQTGLLAELKDIREQTELLKIALSAKVDDLTLDIDSIKSEAESIINNQPSKPQTQGQTLQNWRNAMKSEYELGSTGIYLIPFADLQQLALPKTATQKYYYKAGQRLAILLAELGYTGKLQKEHIQLTPFN